MFHQKTPLSPKGDKGVIKPLRYHSKFRALSRFACSRRTASLRLGQNPVPLCGPWAFALASVHPCCSRRLSASLYGTRASYNGDLRRSLLAWLSVTVALGPRLPGDIRRVRPAALAPCGRLSERFHPATRPDPSLVLFRPPLGADAFYIIGADGICQPFSGEKFHKKLAWGCAPIAALRMRASRPAPDGG